MGEMEQRRRPSNAGEDEMLRCVVCRRTSAAEALLLPCLHNCCTACIAGLRGGGRGSGNEGDGCEHAASRRGAAAATEAICPLCDEAVPSTDALRCNLHAAAIERSRCERTAGAACDGCRRGFAAAAPASESAASATRSSAAAAYRCVQCRISLCGACKREHEKFLQHHDIRTLDAYYASRDAAADVAASATPASASVSCGLCVDHGRELEFACEQCGGLRCGRCLALCLRERHSLITIDECVSGARVDLAAAVDAAREQLAALDAEAVRRGERVAALETLRAACREQLSAGRERARVWLDECHDAARRTLDEHVDALIGEERRCGDEAVLRERVEYACDYGASLLRHDDAASVLDQHELVRERLRRLTAAAADVTATAVTARGGNRKLVVESRQTEDVRSALREIVGVPRLIAAEDRSAEDDSRLSVFAETNGANDRFTFTFDEPGTGGLARTTRHELAFLEPTHFQTPVQCSDVAVTGDGCIVLATGMGLREYDSRGVELAAVNVNCWYACVDVLGDGRVAAGNSARRQIEVFARPGTAAVSWRLAGVVATGVEAELLAVAPDADPTAAAHDRRLWLYDASGRQILSKTLDYNIAALAVAPDRVVLVSFNAVSRGRFLVEAYTTTADGATLWRHSNSERTWGVCADRWGNAYLALVNRNAVRVLGSDGRQQADVLRGRRLTSPWRLAVDRAGTRLVVLSHDRCSLSVFPMAVSAAEATPTGS